MHILYLHQYFALPTGSTGTRSYEMARRWVAAGHKVTIICGRGENSGLPELRSFDAEGVDVCVIGLKYSQQLGFLRRVLVFGSFMAAAVISGLRVRQVDAIFATSTPLTIGITAIVINRIRGIPFIFEVRDQWPEVPIQMGYIRSPLLKRFLLWLERTIYQRATAIVALSPGMAEGIRSVLGKADKPIVVAPNSADLEFFHNRIDGKALREKLGLDDKCIVLHFGTMGQANGLDFLLEAAEQLRSDTGIVFVLIGSGKERQRLEEKAHEMALSNVRFFGIVPKSQMPKWVAACDISTVIFSACPILEHNSANKFFDSLAAGKPILLNYSGWQRELLEKHGAGMGCCQGDLVDYTNKLSCLGRNPGRMSAMGIKARQLAESEFSRDRISDRVLELIRQVT